MLFRELKKLLIIIMIVFIPIQSASACNVFESCWWDGSGDDGDGGGGNINDPFAGIDSLISDVEALSNDIGDGFNEIPSFFDGLYQDVLQLVNGIDPNLVANTIITEFQNENNCIDLPRRLDEVTSLVLNNSGVYDLKIPDEVKNAISAVSFSRLEIIGIDPATATGEDLYYYKITTVKPLETMKGITGSIFKIPFVIGSEIANSCANAAEFRIAQREDEANLKTQIHRILSTDGVNNIQFLLPNEKGGNLEDVGSLVSEIIETYEGMEIPVSQNVYHAMMKAERYMDMGQFHRAFKAYRMAYRGLSGSESRH